MSRLSTKTHPLLTNDIIRLLFNKHIHTILNFINADNKQLVNITNLTYKMFQNVLTIKKHIANKNSSVVRYGLEYFNELLKKCAILPTGIKNLDMLLDGGLNTGNVYEICGLPACGKTQFCLFVAKNTIRNFEQHVYYFDTKQDFNCKRIKAMLEADNVVQAVIGEIFSKILIKQANNLHQLINALYELKNEMNKGLKLRLIIIDSLPVLLYQISDVSKRNGFLNHVVNVVRFMCVEYHVTFVVTNVLTTWNEGNFEEEHPALEKIGGGKYWQSVPNIRLKFLKENPDGRVKVSILKTNRPTNGNECFIEIGASGIT